MSSIFDSIVTAVMEPAKETLAAREGAAPAAPRAAAAAAPARPAAPGPRPAAPSAAGVAAAVGASVNAAGAAAAPATAPAAAIPAAPSAAPAAPAAPRSRAEVEALIGAIAARKSGTFNWQQSIVDLMKLLDLDSSLGARKQLAQELGYDGKLDGSAEMNLWLHRQVMEKLASGGLKRDGA